MGRARFSAPVMIELPLSGFIVTGVFRFTYTEGVSNHQTDRRGEKVMLADSQGSGNMAQSPEIILVEFEKLKEEVLKRIEIRFQLIALAIVAPGTIIAVGLQTRNATLMLLYPILSMFLTGAYASNEHQVKQIREYLKWIEVKLGKHNMCWQHFSSHILRKKAIEMHLLSSIGIFFGIGLVMILGALSFLTYNTSNTVLLVTSIFCVLLMPIILYSSIRVNPVVPSDDGVVAGASISPQLSWFSILRLKWAEEKSKLSRNKLTSKE
jgi:hypothetical protein